MISVNPYLNFLGQTEDAMKFYSAVFGADLAMLSRFSDTPGHESLRENEKSMIMHAALPLGSTILMATDALESMGHTVNVGNNFSLAINTESKEETDKLFTALSEGGQVTMPPQDTFWGAYFGMCTDKFGIQWMFNYELPKA